MWTQSSLLKAYNENKIYAEVVRVYRLTNICSSYILEGLAQVCTIYVHSADKKLNT